MYRPLCLFLVLIPCFLLGQESYRTIDQVSNSVQRSFEKAQKYIADRDLIRAEQALSDIVDTEPLLVRARVLLGHVYYERDQAGQAIVQYRKALQQAPDLDQRLWFQFAETLREEGLFAEAAEAYTRFLSTDERNDVLRQKAERGLEISRFAAQAIAHPQLFDPVALPESINTPKAEYLPSLTADQSLLVYTAVRDGQEDFYQSRYENGTWTAGRPITDLNTRRNEGAQTISADGRVMVFTACNRPEGQGGCDLYISFRADSTWSTPQNMGSTVNTPQWDSQPSLSANGRLLYFASNRPGGKGGHDIWITYRRPDGTWIRPVNAGEPINTPGNEQSPFIHADGRTLYFMSDGHIGMGGYDLYLTRLQADGTWSTVQNLGYPINTPSNEGALIVQRDGQYAYFSKDVRDRPRGEPITDIYRFALPKNIQPDPVTYVRARVLDATNRQPIRAMAELKPLDEELMYYQDSTDYDGSFLICLPQGRDYALAVEKSGYLFYSEYFDLNQTGTLEEPYELEVLLQPIMPKADSMTTGPVVLRNVFFETGSAELLPASETELNRLYTLLVERPDLRIRINGHTDNVGSDADNQVLSENRAQAVYQYLINKGIAAERLSYVGFGESRPIANNDSPKGRSRNRRTEFEVIRLDQSP